MRYDDRLATVLGQPAADARGRAVQWRQLVELLARGGEVSPDLADRALARIAQLMKDLPVDLLAATARSIAGRPVPAELVALFAARGAAASAALLASADLTPTGWNAVRAVAADEVMPLLRALDPARPVSESSSAAASSSPVAQETPADPVGPVVSAAGLAPPAAPTRERVTTVTPIHDHVRALGPAVMAGLFRWETGPSGEIEWVEGAPRAALVGRSLNEDFADPFASRLPFADAPVVLSEEGVLAGEWRWSGAPAFFADTGRFAGYRGVARREGPTAIPAPEDAAVFIRAEGDELRELMHELRTPLNAIIGFGEIIEGQYLGPAHRAYRERATEIVRQARSLSDAVDNLDLAARLRSGRLDGEATSEAEAIRMVLDELRMQAALRQLRLEIKDRSGGMRIKLPRQLAERLVGQFAAAMLEPAVAGERLGIVLDRQQANLVVGIERAAALRGMTEPQLLAVGGHAGMAFTLRLVQGLAAMTGGRLDIAADRLVLLLPLAE
jgi:hypothetical protein